MDAVIEASARDLVLPRNEVHIWSASLELNAEELECLQAALAPDELDRAAQFRFPHGRRQFIAARGLLRQVLSLYCHLEPAALHFRGNAFGKPEFPAMFKTETRDLRFNYSHSQMFAVFAIAQGREVGVDVEFVRPNVAIEQIAQRFFSRNESAALRAMPATQHPEYFFKVWTTKEAYVKARGQGIRIPFDSFEVFPVEEGSSAVTGEDGKCWGLHLFSPAPGFVASVASEGQQWHPRFIASANEM
jgi:4'-phosphopantetheinyl transferase